jgi:hypothetical protein
METQDYEQRQFMIFNVSELTNIDFSQVLETSIDTVRKSIDETKTFVKWDGDTIPSSVDSLITKEGPYTYQEIIDILNTPEWTSNEMILVRYKEVGEDQTLQRMVY